MITIEGDQRHAEISIQQVGLSNERSASTPGDRINPKDMTEDDHKELSATDAKIYRGAAARANYMSIDRSDIRLSVKELTRHMSKPRIKDYNQLMHLGRYLVGKPRVVTQFISKGFQDH